MKNRSSSWLLLALFLVVSAVAFVLLFDEGEETIGLPTPIETPTTDKSVEPIVSPPQAPTRESVTTSESASGESSSAEISTVDPKLAVFRGRCVDSQGRPVQGATATLRGFRSNRNRMAEYVSVHGELVWDDPEPQTTDAGGRFEIRIAPPPPYQIILRLAATGCVGVQGRWSKVEPGTVKDFGDCVLRVGCTLRGSVTDTDGMPRERVSVRLNPLRRRFGFNEDVLRPRSNHSTRTAADGTFQLHDLVTTGKWNIVVSREELISNSSIEIIAADRDRFLELKVKSKADIPTIRGMVVEASGQPLPAQVAASSRNFGVMGVATKSDGSFVIERQKGQGDEPVMIRVTGQGLERDWTKKLYKWGATDVRIVGRRASSISVVVTNAATGDPVEEFGVRILQSGDKWRVWSSWDTGVRGRGKHEGGRVQLTQIRRGEYRFCIIPTGSDWIATALRKVMVGEQHPSEVRFELTRAVVRLVKVITADGKPVVGTKIELLEAMHGIRIDQQTFVSREDGSHMSAKNQASLVCEGLTNADGVLELHGPGVRSLGLRVLGPGHRPIVVRDILLDSGSDPIVVKVPLGATVFGRIRPAKILQQMREMAGDNQHAHGSEPGLRFSRDQHGVDAESYPAQRRPRFEVNEDGSFEVTGIGTGSWDVTIWWWKALTEGTSTTLHLPVGRIKNLREGERRELDLDLSSRLFAKVVGRVIIGDTPYGGQVVFLKDGKWVDSTMSNDEGKFVTFLAPGSYRVKVQQHLLAAEFLVLTPGQEMSKEFRVAAVTVRLRVLDVDGKPRSGVGIFAVDTASRMTAYFASSGKDGHTEVQLSPGTYGINVMPKRLTSREALRKFYEKHRNDPDAIHRVRVSITTIEVVLGSETRIDVRLPVAAGY